ncbi:MAG: NAD(+)/NADH kinase, partial [Cetobacterium sp.]
SAGGPIVMPQIKAIVVTPLAPHNLATRPIIISGDEKLIVTLNPEQKGSIIIDGENELEINKDEKVSIYYSNKKINLILTEGRDYYGILRDKLKWGDNLC